MSQFGIKRRMKSKETGRAKRGGSEAEEER